MNSLQGSAGGSPEIRDDPESSAASVVSTLDELTQDDMMRILVEPKDAIIKQYRKIFEMENVTLKVTDGALRSIAKLSVTGKPAPGVTGDSRKHNAGHYV